MNILCSKFQRFSRRSRRLALQVRLYRMETQIHVPLGSPVIRKIPIFVDEHNVTQGAMKLIKQLRPAWDISNVKTKVP